MPRSWTRLSTLLAVCLLATVVRADDTGEEPDLKELANRLERVEMELLELQAKQGKEIPKGSEKVLTLVESPYYGSTSFGSSNAKQYLAARLVFVNLTNKAIEIEPLKIKLDVDGDVLEYKAAPSNYGYYSFQVGSQSHQLRNLKPKPKLTVRPGATGSSWVFFFDVPAGNNVPSMVLDVPVGEEKVKVDVNAAARDLLALKVERIGPSRSLGLVTVGGKFNTINAGALVETLDQLVAQRVARVVVRWEDSATPLESYVWSWLQQATAFAGRQEMQPQQLPILPASIRELHLANVPGQNSNSRYSYGEFSTDGRIHDDDVSAITAALRSAYEVLPRDELLREMRDGDPATRAAAIIGGGGRLTAEQLPLLLKHARGDDAALQRAALGALRHFGEDAAVEALVEFVRKGADPLDEVAIESLARSRFRAAHDALLEVLANEPPESKVEIVKVLAKYPRPAWSETIYEFVDSDNAEVAVAALDALVRIGHPKLFDVLRKHLQGGNSVMEDRAYTVLSRRTDAESETLALEYTLEKLEKSPPTAHMYTFIGRTKDPRAIKPLLKHFGSTSGNRSQMINVLAQIGDEKVAEAFAEQFDGLKQYERVTVLRALQQMRSPAFRKLAAKALLTNDSSLVSAACEGLRLEAGPEAVGLLVNALGKTTDRSAMSYITNTLSQLATPEAKRALVEARRSKDSNKQRYANNALRSMYQRSPGYQYMYQAREHTKNKRFKQAIKQFDVALKLDPTLPEAAAERGNAHLNLGNLEEAHRDYKRALELDDWNSLAIAGLGIVLARKGDVDEAITYVEDQKSKHDKDSVYAYNMACVYARGVEALSKEEEPDEKRVAELTAKAVAELKRSKQLGFSDLDWMKKDPDLVPLHGDPEFQKVVGPAKPAENATEEAEESVEVGGAVREVLR